MSLYDPGMQPERTRLSWQRTGLAGLVAGLFVARTHAWATVVVGALIAVVLWSTYRRLRLFNEGLLGGRTLPGAGPLGAVAAVTSLLSVVAAVAVAEL